MTRIEKVKQTWLDKMFARDFDELSWELKRRVVIHEQDGKCLKCGVSSWFETPICLEIDHRDGNNHNNSRGNLEGLCPNCHSITDTWRGKNKNQGQKVSDEVFLKALKEAPNIRQALIKLGLSPKGGNYQRAYHLLDQ